MLGHRLRRWPNIQPALDQRVMLLGNRPRRIEQVKMIRSKCVCLWL